ncbi:MAG: hypothetical protein OQK98_06790 [Gammaproteobacteria bacterium]|nr:hypothetical protein [Gammaproteobacteria bacterium]
MTLEKAREMTADQVAIAGGYNQALTRFVLGELQNDIGQNAVDNIIHEFGRHELRGFVPGTKIERIINNK